MDGFAGSERGRHPLVLPAATPAQTSPVGSRAAGGPAWPTFTGAAQLVGTSGSAVTVYVDASLGKPGVENGQNLLADADRVVRFNNTVFNITAEPVEVVIFALNGQTDGTGGADHGGCSFRTGNAIEVDAAFGNTARVSALFEAELSECAMQGQLCGLSTGEALSRWCAAVVSQNALADFATAPRWVQDGMPNWVDQTDPSDQHPDSTGCGVAFLSWLLSQQHSLAELAQAMVALTDSGTLAELYLRLTGQPAAQAWPAFRAAVLALPGPVSDDDPFGALTGIGGSPTTPGGGHQTQP